jgi:hypothetical protein
MAPADTFSPPGGASYSSNTLSVGDGTWDFTKNTFLLPNLMGLNFETMRYNGMHPAGPPLLRQTSRSRSLRRDVKRLS